MKSKILFAFLAAFIANSTHAAENYQGGKVTWLRFHTSSYPNSAVTGTALIKLDTALLAPCVGLWVASSDEISKVALYKAKASGASVSIAYDNSVPTPWGDAAYCRLHSFDIN